MTANQTSEIYYYQPNIGNHRMQFILGCFFAVLFILIAFYNEMSVSLPNGMQVDSYWVNLSALFLGNYAALVALAQIKAAFLRKVPKRRLIIEKDRLLAPIKGNSPEKLTIKFDSLIDKQVVRLANRQYLKLKSASHEWHIYEAGFNDQRHFDHMIKTLDRAIGDHVDRLKKKNLVKLKPQKRVRNLIKLTS